jgi:hypothetical protein
MVRACRGADACEVCQRRLHDTCDRCGERRACRTCDRCHGCDQVICRVCDTLPPPAFSSPGDTYWHPHSSGALLAPVEGA